MAQVDSPIAPVIGLGRAIAPLTRLGTTRSPTLVMKSFCIW